MHIPLNFQQSLFTLVSLLNLFYEMTKTSPFLYLAMHIRYLRYSENTHKATTSTILIAFNIAIDSSPCSVNNHHFCNGLNSFFALAITSQHLIYQCQFPTLFQNKFSYHHFCTIQHWLFCSLSQLFLKIVQHGINVTRSFFYYYCY